MKTVFMRWLLFILLPSCAMSAETKTNDLPRVRLRAEFIDRWKPFRVIGGELYDFTPVFVSRDQGEEILSGFSRYVIKGEVLQVVSDGLLVKPDDLEETVYLRNAGDEKRTIDGARILALAVWIGRYQYVNTHGATATIRKYECGYCYDPMKETFKTKRLTTKQRDTVMEIPPLDLAAFSSLSSTNAKHN